MRWFCSWNCVIFFICGGCYVTHIGVKDLPTLRQRTTVLGVRLPPILEYCWVLWVLWVLWAERLRVTFNCTTVRWSTTRKYRLVQAEFNTSCKRRKFMPIFYIIDISFRTFADVFCEPQWTRYGNVCVFVNLFSQGVWTCFGGGEAYLGPEKTHLPGEGKRSPFVHGSTGTDRTREKIQDLPYISKSQPEHSGLGAENMCDYCVVA